MLFQDPLDDIKPKSGPFLSRRLGGKEGDKKVFELRLGDAGAVILDFQIHPGFLRPFFQSGPPDESSRLVRILQTWGCSR